MSAGWWFLENKSFASERTFFNEFGCLNAVRRGRLRLRETMGSVTSAIEKHPPKYPSVGRQTSREPRDHSS